MTLAERRVVILRYMNKVPSVAACSKCNRKFFAPDSYYNDRTGAEHYLRRKFNMHRCEEEPTLAH